MGWWSYYMPTLDDHGCENINSKFVHYNESIYIDHKINIEKPFHSSIL